MTIDKDPAIGYLSEAKQTAPSKEAQQHIDDALAILQKQKTGQA